MSTKKQKIIIETTETTQTIKTTTVKTKTTSISSKKLATLSDSSDTSNDASSLKEPLTNSIFIYLLDFNDPYGRNHWVLFTNIHKINCWSVYDSIGYNAKDYKPFFKSLFPKEKQVTIEKVACQKQSESWTCGLFCLANATALCLGSDPNKYIWDQKDMVNCYNRFLGNLNVEMFTCSEKKLQEQKCLKLKCYY